MRDEYIGKVVSFKIKGWKEIIQGILINFNVEWVLIKKYFDYCEDGYLFMKNEFISKYKRDEEEEIFIEKVISVKNDIIHETEQLTSININQVLSKLTEKYGLIGIKTKRDDVIWIGKYIQFKNNKIHMKLIGTKAEWLDVKKFKLNSIKSIDFCTNYNNALYQYNKYIENEN